jgi:hypothetical protein
VPLVTATWEMTVFRVRADRVGMMVEQVDRQEAMFVVAMLLDRVRVSAGLPLSTITPTVGAAVADSEPPERALLQRQGDQLMELVCYCLLLVVQAAAAELACKIILVAQAAAVVVGLFYLPHLAL